MSRQVAKNNFPGLCHVIRVTPRGRGAVATLFLVGAEPLQVIRPFLDLPDRTNEQTFLIQGTTRPCFARFQLGESREEIILSVRENGFLELHCHGGETVLDAIENTLAENGAVPMTWEQWLRETQNNACAVDRKSDAQQGVDAIQREALRLLPYAETEHTARLLMAQYHGALSRLIRRLQTLCAAISSRQTSSVRVANDPCVASDNDVADAIALVESLLDSYKAGRHLLAPLRISVVGPVNVGKSTLVNALLGFERAITSPMPGTTRDPVSAKTVLRGWPIVLTDTAGSRDTSDPIEQEGISRTQTAIANADLVLNVIDTSVEQNHLPIGNVIPDEISRIDIVNKIDIMSPTVTASQDDRIFLSAKTGQGIPQLVDEIFNKTMSSRRHNADSSSDCAMVFSESQYRLLTQIKTALQKQLLSDASHCTACLLGHGFSQHDSCFTKT